jgi:hypothetical protein
VMPNMRGQEMKRNTNATAKKAGHSLAATTDNTASAVIDSRTSPKTDDSTPSGASELRARALRYRLLAETLSATGVIAIVQAYAHKLDAQAALMEMSQAPL